jgi:tetrahydromethanopterin S-methyltransferase subunit E
MKKLLLIPFIIATFGLAVAAIPASVQAQDTGSSKLIQDSQCQSGVNSQCVGTGSDAAATANCETADNCNLVNRYLNPFILLLSVLVGIAVTLGIIIGGIQYASSGGDPQKVAGAKIRIRNSIVALVMFFFLYAFLQFLIPGRGLLVG